MYLTKSSLPCRVFYKTAYPENTSLEDLLIVYKELVVANGFHVEWHFFKKRSFVYYLVLKIEK